MILESFVHKKRLHYRMRCDGCSVDFERQKRVYNRSLHPEHCRSCCNRFSEDGVLLNRPACPDCGKAIWRGSTKCKSCAQRLPRPNCKQCGSELSKGAKSYCLACHNRQQNKGLSKARTLFNVSPSWKKVRTECFERDNYTCVACLKRGGSLHAHHVKSFRDYPALRLDVMNLQTMCKACHDAHHGLTPKAAAV